MEPEFIYSKNNIKNYIKICLKYDVETINNMLSSNNNIYGVNNDVYTSVHSLYNVHGDNTLPIMYNICRKYKKVCQKNDIYLSNSKKQKLEYILEGGAVIVAEAAELAATKLAPIVEREAVPTLERLRELSKNPQVRERLKRAAEKSLSTKGVSVKESANKNPIAKQAVAHMDKMYLLE